MTFCKIDWNVLGTWGLVIGTWVLALFTWRLVRGQEVATAEQNTMARIALAEQRDIARTELAEQQKIARTQLAVRVHMDMEERFDRPAMLRQRALLAQQVLSGYPSDDFSDAIPEFFESLAILDRLDYLVPELTYNTFSYYTIYWWTALKERIIGQRFREGYDPSSFEEFEHFAHRLLEKATRGLPTEKAIHAFLENEATRAMHLQDQ